jgi:hypothetical protein
MTQLAGKCFTVVSAGGTAQQGSILTRSNAAHKRLYLYPNQTTGYSALVIKPGDMRDMARMTWAGFLNAGNKIAIADLCAISGTPDFSASLVASISALTVVYGDTSVGAWSTTECFGTRLRLTGKSGELVQFSLEMVGKATTTTTVSAPAIAEAEFFPFEKGTQDIGADTVLAFDIDYRTGFFARFAPDGEPGYSGINESLRQRMLRARLTLAQNAVAEAEYAKYAAQTAVTPTLSLSGSAGTGCAIALGGYYTDWRDGEFERMMVNIATLTGVYDGRIMLSMN